MADEKKAAAKDDKAKEAEQKAAEKAAAEEEAAVKAEAEEEVERDRLIWEGTSFFGVPPHVVAGALSNMDGRRESFKPSEVADEIDKFLNRVPEEA